MPRIVHQRWRSRGNEDRFEPDQQIVVPLGPIALTYFKVSVPTSILLNESSRLGRDSGLRELLACLESESAFYATGVFFSKLVWSCASLARSSKPVRAICSNIVSPTRYTALSCSNP